MVKPGKNPLQAEGFTRGANGNPARFSQHPQSFSRPKALGLYDPMNEHDACGLGLVANIHNKKSHDIIEKGLEILVIWKFWST